jgi:hypothetical protein
MSLVIASEAKQSIAPQRKNGLLRRCAPRNDDILSYVVPANAGTHTPRPVGERWCWTTFAQHNVLWLWVPAFAGTTPKMMHHPDSISSISTHTFAFPRHDAPGLCSKLPPRRAWGMPGARAPAAARGVVNTRVSHHGYAETPGIPARSGFNGFLRALPGDRALLSPSSANTSANLTPASRRQDHTTSPSASAPFVKGASTSTASHPASVTIAIRPSCGTRRGDSAFDLGVRSTTPLATD